MKIKFSAIVSDARGKIGGNVFSRNKAGAYVRTFVKPTNPNSAAQQIIRNRIQGLVTGWRALTDAVRLGWNQTTHNFPQSNKLGETFYLTGQQLFTKFNSNRLAFGEAAATTPPLNSSEDVITITDVAITSASAVISVDVATIPVTAETIIRATDGLSAGRSNAFRSQFKQIGEAETATANDIDIKAAYEAVFGALTDKVGQKVFVELLTCDKATGQVVGKSKMVAVVGS